MLAWIRFGPIEPQLLALSACGIPAPEPPSDFVVTHAVSLELTDVDDIVSASIDGTHATFLGTTSVVLFDVVTGRTPAPPEALRTLPVGGFSIGSGGATETRNVRLGSDRESE